MKQALTAVILFLFLVSVAPVSVSAQGHPIGVGGYIYTLTGDPVDNASVSILNMNTSEVVYAMTNSLGKFGRAITGESGDILYVIAVKGGLSGHNQTIVNILNPTQWVNVTITVTEDTAPRGETGGDTNPSLPPPDNNASIPPPQRPKRPDNPTSQYEAYDLLKILSLPNSTNKITVMVIDSGAIGGLISAYRDPNSARIVNMGKIDLRYNTKYFQSGVDELGHGSFTNFEIAYILQLKLNNSQQISYRVFSKTGTTSTDIILDALHQAETIRPDVVSMSIGATGNPNDALAKEVEKLRGMGIVVVVAAGNYGWNRFFNKAAPSSITSPAVSEGALSVGAFDTQGTKTFADDVICLWSSRGPVPNVTPPKPECAAPGESLVGIDTKGLEVVSSGTSFACPLIAGGTAVVLANTKDQADQIRMLFFWDAGTVPRAYEDALRESCIQKGDVNDWGDGIPQFDKVLTIFQGKLTTLLYEFIAIIVIIAIIVAASVSLYLFRFRHNKRGLRVRQKY